MSGFYDRMGVVAKRLIDKFDQGGTSKVAEAITPNPDPLKPPSVVSTPTAVPAVVRGVSASIVNEHTNLSLSDLMVICCHVDYAPKVEDSVTINSEPKRVLIVEPIPAAGVPIIYRFYVR